MSQETHDKLRHAQALLGHRIPNGNLTEVLDRVLSLAIEQLEKNKFAATTQPRSSQRRPNNPRTILPRPGVPCGSGIMAGARSSAMLGIAASRATASSSTTSSHWRGGQATVENLRLRCRAHNQYEASATFGAGVHDRQA